MQSNTDALKLIEELFPSSTDVISDEARAIVNTVGSDATFQHWIHPNLNDVKIEHRYTLCDEDDDLVQNWLRDYKKVTPATFPLEDFPVNPSFMNPQKFMDLCFDNLREEDLWATYDEDADLNHVQVLDFTDLILPNIYVCIHHYFHPLEKFLSTLNSGVIGCVVSDLYVDSHQEECERRLEVDDLRKSLRGRSFASIDSLPQTILDIKKSRDRMARRSKAEHKVPVYKKKVRKSKRK